MIFLIICLGTELGASMDGKAVVAGIAQIASHSAILELLQSTKSRKFKSGKIRFIDSQGNEIRDISSYFLI